MNREIFSKFQSGIDRRYTETDTKQNKFNDLLNCHVSVNNRIETRGGFNEIQPLDTNTEGLFPFNGKLYNFQADGSIAVGTIPSIEAIPEVWTIILGHSGVITRVHYVGVLLGGLYCSIEFDDGEIAHYYMVTNLDPWTANKEYDTDPKGIRVAPKAAKNEAAKVITLDFFYEAAELGDASGGGTEPVWPIIAGDPLTENEVLWNTVKIEDRSTDKQTYGYNPDGVYITPTSNEAVVFRATNIREGESKISGTFGSIAWPSLPGVTVADGSIVWEAVSCTPWGANKKYEIDFPIDEENPELNTYAHTLTSKTHADYRKFVYVGKRGVVKGGPSEPSWPTVDGESVVDGNITWVAKSTLVTDKNCPNTAEVLVIESKVYAIGSNIGSKHEEDIVRYSATNEPFDWTAEQDAGFLPTGTQSAGSEIARSLGRYNNNLVVIMDDNIQIWAVDPDPKMAALIQTIGNVGTEYPDTILPIGTDMVFLTPYGFRSLGQRQGSPDFEDTDVGSPVDDPVTETLKAFTGKPIATLYSTKSQYWCAIGSEIWVWTFSRNNEVKAWSRYTVPHNVRYFAQSGEQLFIRTDDDRLVLLDEDLKTDYMGDFLVGIDFNFQGMKDIGMLKQFVGFDAVIVGEADVSFGVDANNPNAETTPVHIANSTKPGQLQPMQVMSTEVSPRIRYIGPDGLRFDSLAIYYETLGLM